MTDLDGALAILHRPYGRLRFDAVLERQFRRDALQKWLPPMRFAIVLALALYAAFGVLDVWVVPEVAKTIWIIRFAVVVPMLAATLAFTFRRSFRRWMQQVMACIVLVLGLGIVAMVAIAGELGRAYYYAGLILVIIWNYTMTRLTFDRAAAVGWGLLLIYEIVATLISPVPAVVLVNNNFFFVSANLIGMVACYYSERALRTEYVQRRIVRVERHRSEGLLTNVLPATIARRLKRTSGTLADGYAEVTVLFCDLVEFTPLCSRLTALETVTLLNHLFTSLDALAAKHGLEKIKTIGDSYMIVGGVPTPRPDHAEAIAEFALEAQQTMALFRRDDGTPLQARIGIHTGSVVAGVIGSAKLSYDLWGEAVITASRMEHHGIAGAIQVSNATYERLARLYEFAPRGEVEVKGQGTVRCWLLLGRTLRSTQEVDHRAAGSTLGPQQGHGTFATLYREMWPRTPETPALRPAPN